MVIGTLSSVTPHKGLLHTEKEKIDKLAVNVNGYDYIIDIGSFVKIEKDDDISIFYNVTARRINSKFTTDKTKMRNMVAADKVIIYILKMPEVKAKISALAEMVRLMENQELGDEFLLNFIYDYMVTSIIPTVRDIIAEFRRINTEHGCRMTDLIEEFSHVASSEIEEV